MDLIRNPVEIILIDKILVYKKRKTLKINKSKTVNFWILRIINKINLIKQARILTKVPTKT